MENPGKTELNRILKCMKDYEYDETYLEPGEFDTDYKFKLIKRMQDINSNDHTIRVTIDFPTVIDDKNTYTNDELLNEDTSEERNIINIKNNNKQNNKQNKNEFLNIKPSSKYNSSDRMNKYSESSESSDDTYSNEQVLIILQQVISKLNKMEQTINNINHFNNQNNNQSRNMYDIILYIIIGMILAFMLFSICSSIKHIK